MIKDERHCTWAIEQILKKKNMPYSMHNEQLADEIFPTIKIKFPNANMVKFGLTQWITVTEKAKKNLVKNINENISDYETSIKVMKSVLKELN